ncbi:hypothetical protein ACQKGC_08335 [Allorhizobium pseudoryzae]|uniref:hypothetical protein n=1 Tax=Allorhizobium pseudoryzae TaxID=379684 RepID=UPI003D03C3BE
MEEKTTELHYADLDGRIRQLMSNLFDLIEVELEAAEEEGIEPSEIEVDRQKFLSAANEMADEMAEENGLEHRPYTTTEFNHAIDLLSVPSLVQEMHKETLDVIEEFGDQLATVWPGQTIRQALALNALKGRA